MKTTEIRVIYKWTAKPGKLNELKTQYRQVMKEMDDIEPDTEKMEVYFNEESETIFIHDVFKDGAALGLHLSGIAAKHMPELSKLADFGPFIFLGDVPEELQKAIKDMNLGPEFASYAFGFERHPEHA